MKTFQKNCHLSANQYTLLNTLFDRLVVGDTKDKMKLYEYTCLSVPKKLEVLLTHVDEITKDELNESTY